MSKSKLRDQFEGWKSKLLDLGKKNPLIYFKPRKTSTIQILHPTADELLSVLDFPLEFANLFDQDTSLDIFEDIEQDFIAKEQYQVEDLAPRISAFLSQNKTRKKYVFSDASARIQQYALNNLHKRTQLFKDENAIHILYLAVGFLHWGETKDQEAVHASPLILIPVELKQTSFDAPYVLSFSQSELLLNESLIKKMSAEFNINLDFVFDDAWDEQMRYKTYMTYVQSRLKYPKWHVSTEMYLGNFTFAKINMYNDLETNKAEMLASPIIQALAGDAHLQMPTVGNIEEEAIDQLIDPNAFYQVLDADASQQQAIQSALKGQSFVLQGPPGTGKSQTITNMIAELIARGKKVLFVAEKKAALDVVYNNLKKAGIEQYALPLHDPKIDKQIVIKELHDELLKRQKVVKVNKQQSAQIISDYQFNKNELSQYAKALLAPRQPLNLDIYAIYNLYLKYQQAKDLQFEIDVKTYDHQKLNGILNQIHQFEEAKAEIGQAEDHVFYGLKYFESTLSNQESFKKQMAKSYQVVQLLNDLISTDTLPFHLNPQANIKALDEWMKLYQFISTYSDVPERILKHKQIQDDLSVYQKLDDEIAEFSLAKQSIENRYAVDVVNLEIDHIASYFKQATFFKRLSRTYKAYKNELLIYQLKPNKHHKKLIQDLDYLQTVKHAKVQIDASLSQLKFKHGINFDHLEAVHLQYKQMQWAHDFNQIYQKKLFEKTDIYQALTKKQLKKKAHQALIKQVEKAYQDIIKQISLLQPYFEMRIKNFSQMSLPDLQNSLLAMIENLEDSYPYLNYTQVANQETIKPFFELLLKEKIQSGYSAIFLKRFYLLLIHHIFSYDQTLKGFTRNLFDKYQTDFKKADVELIEMVGYQIQQLMSANAPSIEGLEATNHEIVVLRREANKTRKIMPLRLLFSQTPHLIMQLKPILMMSPLSVSSFLKSKHYQFDTVIFDEASQIKPESAIGAIYRSQQVIIVGDREQLPPTDFFQNVESNEDIEVDYDAYDSILDIASASLKPIFLSWHYRSQYEELIQISNQHIYENKLITFPSQHQALKDAGVDLVYVKGVFSRGVMPDAGTNLIEAKRVVELTFEHFDRYQNKRSLGIVTFNSQQQHLIERLINLHRRQHPQYESYLNPELANPFFIKNIETVQGDERDTIIMSVAYGYDDKGKILMNFGPLNRERGHRRLNVAITRAKYHFILVSSIRSTDVDIEKTNSRGVALLKQYLHFAEFNKKSTIQKPRTNQTSNALIGDVYQEIIKLGYEVQRDVGTSDFRIDLAVVHPNDPNQFVLAIECDGSLYMHSKVTRDRERLRQEVLSKRGWQIYRIWSTDWLNHRKREVDYLRKAIERALKKQGVFAPQIKPVVEKSISLNQKEVIVQPSSKQPVVDVLIEKNVSLEPKFTTYPVYETVFQKYKILPTQKVLEQMLRDFAPIHVDEVKAFAPMIYNSKTFNNYVSQFYDRDLEMVLNRGQLTKQNNFFLVSNKKIVFRKHNEVNERRFISHIHSKELEDGLLSILTITKSMKVSTLMEQLLQYLGYKQVTEVIQTRLNRVLSTLEIKEQVEIIDQIIHLKV